MSRPAARRQAAALKRLPMDHFPDAGKMIDDDDDEGFEGMYTPTCPRCRGDGMDPQCDGVLPCQECQGEQQP